MIVLDLYFVTVGFSRDHEKHQLIEGSEDRGLLINTSKLYMSLILYDIFYVILESKNFTNVYTNLFDGIPFRVYIITTNSVAVIETIFFLIEKQNGNVKTTKKKKSKKYYSYILKEKK